MMKETVNVYGILLIKRKKYPPGRKKRIFKLVLAREVAKF